MFGTPFVFVICRGGRSLSIATTVLPSPTCGRGVGGEGR